MKRDIESRVGLSVLEAGWLLEKSESTVRGMLKRGELEYAVAGKKVCPDSLAALFSTGLQSLLLRALLAGRLVAPLPERRFGPPASLWDGFDQLYLAGPTLIVNRSSAQTNPSARESDEQ